MSTLVLWHVYSFLVALLLVTLVSGIILVPTYRIHTVLRRRRAKRLGPVGRALYFIPSLAVIAAGIHSRSWPIATAALDVGASQWILLLLCSLYVGLEYMKRAESDDKTSVLRWVAGWPGWFRQSAPEPPGQTIRTDITRFAVLPGIAALTALADTIGKAAGLFANTPAPWIIQAVFITGAVGVAVHSLTATDDHNTNVGGTRKVLRYPKPARLAAVAGAALAVILWAASAAYEPTGELRIAAATLLGPEDRLMELTLVNQGQHTHVLRGFQVESRTAIPFQWLSAEFDIPVVAEYSLPFHIAQPLTEIAADPPKQFQPQAAGRIALLSSQTQRAPVVTTGTRPFACLLFQMTIGEWGLNGSS